MTAPLFSIITITMNNQAGLTKTGISVHEQTCHDYEWIIIDGGSGDQIPDDIPTKNVTYISEADNGLYDAMNKGIRNATGQYLIFMNAGDCFESKNTLFEIQEHIKDEEFDFIYGDSLEEINTRKHYKRSKPHPMIGSGMITHHQAIIYNAKLFKDLNYDLKYKISADYDLTFKAISKSENFLYLPFPICIFEAGGLSQQNAKQGRTEEFKIRRAQGVSLFNASRTYIKQAVSYQVRRLCPALYWRLKSG